MTTDSAPGRIAARRFDRLLSGLIAVFAVLYALQTADSFAVLRTSVHGPLGGVLVGLMVVSLVVGAVGALLPRGSALCYVTAFAIYAVGLAVWPFAISTAVPASPLAWPVAIWPVLAIFLAAAHDRALPAVALGAATAVPVALVLLRIGGVTPAGVVIHCAFMLAASVALSSLLGAVRQAIDLADLAQDRAVARFAEAKHDDAVEVERIRTDALVHDCVLTTLLSAGSAGTPAEDELARRMAANALRVLGHVNRSADQGPAVTFRQALTQLEPEAVALLARFELQTARTDDLMLPAHVADELLRAMVTVMRESVASGTPRFVRTRPLGPDGIRIVVMDGGTGGALRDDIARRMRSIDGRAEVGRTSAGGTAVTLSWGSAVITGTAPFGHAELLVVA